MTAYACVLIDWHNRVTAPATMIEASAANEAIETALVMLHARLQYSAVELWDQQERLYPVRSQTRRPPEY